MAFADLFSGTSFLIIAVSVIAIWFIIEIERIKYKILAISIIAILLFFYVTGTTLSDYNEIDITSPSSFIESGKVYFSWIASAFKELKSLTANVINSDLAQNLTNITNENV